MHNVTKDLIGAIRAGIKEMSDNKESDLKHLNHKDLEVPGDFKASYLKGDKFSKTQIYDHYFRVMTGSFETGVTIYLDILAEPDLIKRRQLCAISMDTIDIRISLIKAAFGLAVNKEVEQKVLSFAEMELDKRNLKVMIEKGFER